MHSPISAGGKGVEPPTKFSKRGGGGGDRTLILRGRLVGKGGMIFSRGVAIFT